METKHMQNKHMWKEINLYWIALCWNTFPVLAQSFIAVHNHTLFESCKSHQGSGTWKRTTVVMNASCTKWALYLKTEEYYRRRNTRRSHPAHKACVSLLRIHLGCCCVHRIERSWDSCHVHLTICLLRVNHQHVMQLFRHAVGRYFGDDGTCRMRNIL
jgi:hypothetical protein